MSDREQFRPWPVDQRFSVGDLGTVLGPSGRPVGSRHVDGYRVVSYRARDGRRTSTTAHAMVCETFHGPRREGQQAAHENGDPADDRAANLRWATPTGNRGDQLDHGTHGQRLTREQVAEIRASTASRHELALHHGVTPGTISHVRTGYTWREDYATSA